MGSYIYIYHMYIHIYTGLHRVCTVYEAATLRRLVRMHVGVLEHHTSWHGQRRLYIEVCSPMQSFKLAGRALAVENLPAHTGRPRQLCMLVRSLQQFHNSLCVYVLNAQ